MTKHYTPPPSSYSPAHERGLLLPRRTIQLHIKSMSNIQQYLPALSNANMQWLWATVSSPSFWSESEFSGEETAQSEQQTNAGVHTFGLR